MAVAITQTASVAGVATVANVAEYTSVSIGTESDDRIICVCCGAEENLSAVPNSATIDFGSGDTAMSATTLGQQVDVSARIFYLEVPTGTTATIKVTWSAACAANENHIAVYAITGADPTPAASGSDQSTDIDATDPLTTGSVTIATGGGFLGVTGSGSSSAGKTWTNASEDIDIDADAGGIFRFTTATRTTAGTVTINVNGASNEDGALAWIIFNPVDGGAAVAARMALLGVG